MCCENLSQSEIDKLDKPTLEGLLRPHKDASIYIDQSTGVPKIDTPNYTCYQRLLPAYQRYQMQELEEVRNSRISRSTNEQR